MSGRCETVTVQNKYIRLEYSFHNPVGDEINLQPFREKAQAMLNAVHQFTESCKFQLSSFPPDYDWPIHGPHPLTDFYTEDEDYFKRTDKLSGCKLIWQYQTSLILVYISFEIFPAADKLKKLAELIETNIYSNQVFYQ